MTMTTRYVKVLGLRAGESTSVPRLMIGRTLPVIVETGNGVVLNIREFYAGLSVADREQWNKVGWSVDKWGVGTGNYEKEYTVNRLGNFPRKAVSL